MSADVCLKCTLPICDETLPGCAFVQIRRQERQPYFAAYYRYHRSAKLTAANERAARIREGVTKYQRYYRRNREKRQEQARQYRQTEAYKEANRQRMANARNATKRENSVAK